MKIALGPFLSPGTVTFGARRSEKTGVFGCLWIKIRQLDPDRPVMEGIATWRAIRILGRSRAGLGLGQARMQQDVANKLLVLNKSTHHPHLRQGEESRCANLGAKPTLKYAQILIRAVLEARHCWPMLLSHLWANAGRFGRHSVDRKLDSSCDV